MSDCHNCETVKAVFDEIIPDFSDKVEIQELDMQSPEGQELILKYGIMASPGIVINNELFSVGGIDKEKLLERLNSL